MVTDRTWLENSTACMQDLAGYDNLAPSIPVISAALVNSLIAVLPVHVPSVARNARHGPHGIVVHPLRLVIPALEWPPQFDAFSSLTLCSRDHSIKRGRVTREHEYKAKWEVRFWPTARVRDELSLRQSQAEGIIELGVPEHLPDRLNVELADVRCFSELTCQAGWQLPSCPCSRGCV